MLLSLSEFIGRFHPVLVHLPIGFLIIGLLLQWLSAKPAYQVSKPVIKIVLAAGIIGALLSCITGYLLSIKGDYDEDALALHMWMGIGVAAISMLVYVRALMPGYDVSKKVLALFLFILISLTGHFGGTLTHGEGYLTAALIKEDTLQQKRINNIQEAAVYADVVAPILQTKCNNCHGATKQKGKLRLDAPEWLQKGGEDGTVLHSDAASSLLIKHINLPLEDDDHMPPKGKPQLTENELSLLHWWMTAGAPFDKKVKEVAQTEKIKPQLLALQNGAVPEKAAPPVLPTEPIAAGDAKAITALKSKGVIVLPVAQNSNYLQANFVNATHFTNADMALLLPLKKHWIHLKLNDTPITDSALNTISEFSNLRVLQLNNTAITNTGLQHLKNLTNLQSLSLVGTKVNHTGLQLLQPLPALQRLYLYNTSIDRKEVAKLQKVFPRTMLDTGGYNLPTLPSDTTEVKFVKQQ